MSNQAPARGSVIGSLFAFLAFAAATCAVVLVWRQGREIELLRQTEAETQRVLQLLRAEQRAGVGGADAIVSQLRFWAPKLQTAATPAAEIPQIERRIHDLLEGATALGVDATASFTSAYLKAKPVEDDEFRKWLLRALLAADPARGKEIAIQSVRGLQFPVSPRTREYAADELIRVDRVAAGQLLRDILHYESSRGVDADRIPQEFREKFPEAVYAHGGHFPGFFNFVARYCETDDPERIPTLIMLLGRNQHDLTTTQEVVKQLGTLKARDAVEEIQRVYREPPGISDNPIFRNHCLEALGKILGREACPFFEKELREQTHPIVSEKLKSLMQTHGC